MIPMYFAAEASSGGSPLAALGVDGKSLVFQLITFVLVFLILKKFAFKPITKMLAERRKVISDGRLLGEQMEKEKAKLDVTAAEVIREARREADKIISIAHKESRELILTAEKGANSASPSMRPIISHTSTKTAMPATRNAQVFAPLMPCFRGARE